VTGKDFSHFGYPHRGWHVERLPLLLETSMPGVFAAGDVRRGAVKRVASAVGEGSIAIQTVHEYLSLTEREGSSMPDDRHTIRREGLANGPDPTEAYDLWANRRGWEEAVGW
jgi:hypothetical protein